jgi:hypothetical protein
VPDVNEAARPHGHGSATCCDGREGQPRVAGDGEQLIGGASFSRDA